MISHTLADLARGERLTHWLVLGPFVVKTSDHFEREYMYERERILDIDYLAAEGGEAAVRPVAGQSHANIGLGPKQLAWFEHERDWLNGNRIAGEIIYETVQRNCVIYAAAAIDSAVDCFALLDAYHSGMKVWVNGELVTNQPYGLPKGVRTTMPTVPIRLKKGQNLLLFKFRPGYICDGIDFCVTDVTVSPLVSKAKLPIALGRVRPQPYFKGTPEKPRQVIEAAVLNTSNVANTVRVSVGRTVSPPSGAGGLDSPPHESDDVAEVICEPHKVTPVRLSIETPRDKAGTPVEAVVRARLFGETIEASVEYEAALAPKYGGTDLVLSSFHFDTTYHEEQRVYAMGAFDIVRQYCELHRKDPLFRSIISEVDYLKPYFDVYPEDRATLLKMFREKKSEPDVMYNQPNEQNCGDEGLVRNFLYGQLIHGRVFGNICHAYGPGDVFGHPNQLSQISKKSGCIGVTWGKHIFNFPPFFSHLSLDGSTLPHQRGWADEDDVHQMGLTVKLGDIDQTPPTAWHHDLMPVRKQGTYFDLMSTIHRESEASGAHLPLTSRDMSLYHAATAVSRVDLKIANRLGENLLLDGEKFATIAALLGAKYPEKALDKAWRQILCGQHHDSITGTHNEISFVDLMNSYREVLELGTQVLNGSLDYIARAVETPKTGQPYVVFNSLAWERTDVVHATINIKKEGFVLRDHKGKNVPFEVAAIHRDEKGKPVSADIVFVAEKLPSLGYRVYQIVEQDKKVPDRKISSGNSIENEFYKIELDSARGGGMASLYDKEAKREVLDSARHPGNELAFLEEVSHRNETQHEFYTTGLKMFSGDCPATIEAEHGPVSSTLRVRYSMGELAGVVQEITLYAGIKRIEFRTILLDVQRENYLYCVTFPTNLKGLVPVFDERFGVVARNDSKNYLDFRTHQMVMFSDCAVYAANKWMEFGSSATVKVGKNKYALSMVGLITPNDCGDIAAAEHLQKVFVRKGVTCTPWFDEDGPHWGSYLDHMDDDLLYTRFRISLGSSGKNKYTKKLLAEQSAAVRKEFQARLKKKGFAFLFVKDGDLKDKTWPALPVLLIEAADTKTLEAAMARLLRDFDSQASIELPGETDAADDKHKLDNYGLALLNRGTYANSIEKGGTLCMILGHTCLWYGGTNNFPEGYLIPENKNHVYTYALYPHEGTWREAGTPRAGYEFNHPLVCRPGARGGKSGLPSELSFVKVAPENVILTAMKPFGNPIASFEKNKELDPHNGIMLRLYDTEGTNAEARIAFAGGIKKAWSASLLEEPQAELPIDKAGSPDLLLDIPAFSIETIGFEPGALGKKLPPATLGPEAEPVQPVWVRSWEHDAESMPMGYGAVVCSLSREVKEEDGGKTLRLKVNVVNDYTDATISGKAELVVPPGWKAEPASVSFTVAPLGYQTIPVTIRRPDAAVPGQIKVRHAHDGQVFQDVIEIGSAFNLELTVGNKGDSVVATINNPTNEQIEAEISLVTPIETWGSGLVGPFAIAEIAPRTQGISVAPGETIEIRYEVKPLAGRALVAEDFYWAVVKLMSNGRIQLKRCDNRPPERRMWSEKWFQIYRGAPRRD